MDAASLLGASLAFSVVALPLIFILYGKNITKDMTIMENKIKESCRKELEEVQEEMNEKIDKLIVSMNHKKSSIENLDRICTKLFNIIQKINPNEFNNFK